MVALPLVGGCQCGGLRYAITQPPLMVYNCHCTNCQAIGGGAFSTPMTVLESGFAFTRGEPRVFEWTSDAGNRRFGWFCGDCGSRIAHGQIPAAGFLSVRSGTLDDTSWVEPVGRHLDAERAAVGRVPERSAPQRAAAERLCPVHRTVPRAGPVLVGRFKPSAWVDRYGADRPGGRSPYRVTARVARPIASP